MTCWPAKRNLQTDNGGQLDVWLDYACHSSHAGRPFLLKAGNVSLTGAVPSSGTWTRYRSLKIG